MKRSDTAKAREYLGQAFQKLNLLNEGKVDGYVNTQPTDWLEFQILLREAEALLDSGTDRQPDDRDPGNSGTATEPK